MRVPKEAPASEIKEMREGMCYCHMCREKTSWKFAKDRKSLRCDICGDRIPCARKCEHLDCEIARDELVLMEKM